MQNRNCRKNIKYIYCSKITCIIERVNYIDYKAKNSTYKIAGTEERRTINLKMKKHECNKR